MTCLKHAKTTRAGCADCQAFAAALDHLYTLGYREGQESYHGSLTTESYEHIRAAAHAGGWAGGFIDGYGSEKAKTTRVLWDNEALAMVAGDVYYARLDYGLHRRSDIVDGDRIIRNVVAMFLAGASVENLKEWVNSQIATWAEAELNQCR